MAGGARVWVTSRSVVFVSGRPAHTLSTYQRYVNHSRKVQTMSWTAFHSRGETLHAVVEAANSHRDGILPMQVPGVTENFTDEIDLVGALLLKWHARLSGNIERALLREPMDLEAAVAAAWRTTAEQLVGVRLVIDQCMLAPETAEMATAMERAREREWAR